MALGALTDHQQCGNRYLGSTFSNEEGWSDCPFWGVSQVPVSPTHTGGRRVTGLWSETDQASSEGRA